MWSSERWFRLRQITCIHESLHLGTNLSLYLCLHLELRAGDRERQDFGSQAWRLGQEPAEFHLRPSSEQPIREQELAAAPQ